MKPIELQLDRLIQIWATTQKSYVSGDVKCIGHHYIHRSCKLLRWDLHNIIPLTFEEHRLHHDGLLPIEIKNPFRLQYLENMKNKNYKDYLLENELTEDEWLLEKKKYLENNLK